MDIQLQERASAEKNGSSSPKNEDPEDRTPKLRRKGGLRTMPFIILNESFEKVASYGLMPNMIFYLMRGYHLEAATGTIILSLWSAISNFLAIFGAFLSDSCLGRFRVIALGTFCSLLGTSLLWLTAMVPAMKPPPCAPSDKGDCASATPPQLLLLFGAFALISVGAGCVRPCSMAFGADQVNNKDNPNNERVLDSFFNWYYASTGLSTIIALTVVVYIQDDLGWKVGFGIPALLMVLSLLAFVAGSPLYVHVKAKSNLFTGLLRVPVAAARKRKLSLPKDGRVGRYFCGGGDSSVKAPSDSLRCLNRACLIDNPGAELTLGGLATDPWRLCTVEQVESLKAVVRIMPIWSTGIMMLLALNSSYTTLQAQTMDRRVVGSLRVPAGSFQVFSIVTITFWVAFYDRAVVPLLARLCGKPRGLRPALRMGIGLLLSCLSMAVAGTVESARRARAAREGLAGQPRAVVGMSAMWLVPQLVLVGLAEGFNAVGQIEFYYSQLSKSMSSLAMAVFTLGMAVSSLVGSALVEIVDRLTSRGGKVSWLSTNLNEGHVDYYYWLLAFLGILNFLYFLVCVRFFMPSDRPSSSSSSNGKDEDGVGEAGGERLAS